MSAELRTKSIHLPITDEDGLRISVMSRHTQNNGVTLDPAITPDSFSLWMKELAPPAKLVGDWYKRGLPWEKFEERYLDFLKNPNQRLKIFELIEHTLTQTVTVLCVEDTPDHCHRRLLAEECKRLNSELNVLIK